VWRLRPQATRIDFASLLNGSQAGAKGAYKVRDIQNKRDLGVACQRIGIALAPHQTAFLRLTKISDTCAYHSLGLRDVNMRVCAHANARDCT
jgi:hypothetical protein